MGTLLQMRDIVKRFPGVVALDHVDFDLEQGEVHVLLGENGAGKSTLIKVLSGAYHPDAGKISLDDQPVQINSAIDAQRLGISTIYQEFNLVPELSVAENIFLGRQPRRLGIIDRATMARRAAEVIDRMRVHVPLTATVASLGVAQRQMVEIAKALSMDARILILDEPTAVLSEHEIARLFEIMRGLREQGVAMIFISHHLEEAGEIGNRVTVMRDGRVVANVSATTPRDELVRLMVGRPIDALFPRRRPPTGETLLEVKSLTRNGVFRDISFAVRAGEVVGLAGLVGAGRTEVVRAIFGADPVDAGEVWVQGRQLALGDVRVSQRRGLGLVPEDRKDQGLVLSMSIAENIGLAALKRDTRFGVVNHRKQREQARRIVQDLRVRPPDIDREVQFLSGGNQQKVVIGKWLLANSRVLIMDEPTRGIDVGAKVELYELMNRLTAEGAGILMISSELPEVLGMSDRILVMSEGRITGELSAREATQERVMQLATIANKEVALG